MDSQIRVRFAPSPTGMPHLGNARAAIINKIFALQNNAIFLMRIEDTDRDRSTDEYKHALFDMLSWLNLSFDETPLIQSERFDLYAQKAKYLYENNFAYYCQCIRNENEEQIACNCKLQKLTNGVLRFNVPYNQEIKFTDIVYGDLCVNSNNIESFALVRSDGTPTYMLCVVVDDISSNITHVIRGEDHRTNTFKQILLYNALNAKIPHFAHMPMILGNDKKKLSKRNGGASVEYFQSIGVHYKGFINYMMRLGWGYKNQEYFTLEELVKLFELKNVKTSAAVFDVNKMYKCSEFFIKQDIENGESYLHFANYVNKYKNKQIYKMITKEYIELYNDIAKRCKIYSEIYDMILFAHENIPLIENISINDLNEIENIFNMKFNTEQEYIHLLVEKKLHKSFRLILTGNKIGPDLTVALKYITLNNIKHKIEFAKQFTNTM